MAGGVDDSLPVRAPDGRFPAGVSGNPAGRPAGRKNEITALKQDLEIAIRKSVRPEQVARIVQKVVNKAMNGNLQAAKLILDKVMSNAGEPEDAQKQGGGIRIVIENATFAASNKPATVVPTVTVVEAAYTSTPEVIQ